MQVVVQQPPRRGGRISRVIGTGEGVGVLAEQVMQLVAARRGSQLYPLLRRVNTYLMRWAGKKYKRLRAYKRFIRWWSGVTERDPAVRPLGLDARAGRIAMRRAE